MSTSGIEIPDDVKLKFDDVKMRSTHKYVVFKINKLETMVEVCAVKDPLECNDKKSCKACFEELAEMLKNDGEPRYVLYDFSTQKQETKSSQSEKKGNIAFLYWCPDDAKVKLRMIYASTKEAMKKGCEGIKLQKDIHDEDELDYDKLAASIK